MKNITVHLLSFCPESGEAWLRKNWGLLIDPEQHQSSCITFRFPGASFFFFFFWFDCRLAIDLKVHSCHPSRCILDISNSTVPSAGSDANDLFQLMRSYPIPVTQLLRQWGSPPVRTGSETVGRERESLSLTLRHLCWCVWSHHSSHLSTATEEWQKSHRATKISGVKTATSDWFESYQGTFLIMWQPDSCTVLLLFCCTNMRVKTWPGENRCYFHTKPVKKWCHRFP